MKFVLFLSFFLAISLAGVQSRYTQHSRKAVVDEIQNDVFEILEKVQVDIDNLLSTIQKEGSLSIPTEEWNFFTDLKDKIVSKFQSAKKTMSHLKEALEDVFEDGVEDIEHWAKSVKDVMEETSKAFQDLESELSVAISIGSEIAAQSLNDLKIKMQNDIISASIHIIQITDKLIDDINDSSAAKEFTDLKDKVIAGLRKTKEEMVIVGRKIKGEMSSISRWFKTHFTKDKFEELFNKIKEVLQNVYDMIPVELKEEAAQTFEEIVNEAKDHIKNESKVLSQMAIDKLEMALSDQIDKAVDRLQELISGYGDETL